MAQELEAAGSKVLVYLPDGGDCASKEECAARFHIFNLFSYDFPSLFSRRLCQQNLKQNPQSISPFISSLYSMPSTSLPQCTLSGSSIPSHYLPSIFPNIGINALITLDVDTIPLILTYGQVCCRLRRSSSLHWFEAGSD